MVKYISEASRAGIKSRSVTFKISVLFPTRIVFQENRCSEKEEEFGLRYLEF